MSKLTPYELERLENIKRNEELMRTLGIFQSDVETKRKPSSKKHDSPSSSDEPGKQRRKSAPLSTSSNAPIYRQLRRSSRLSNPPNSGQNSASGINSDPIDFLTAPVAGPSNDKQTPVVLRQLEAPTLPPIDEESLDPSYIADPPGRDVYGTLLFEGEFGHCFRPNMTPEEVLREGSFGGTFFKEHYSSITNTLLPSSDYLSLPEAWTTGLDPSEYLTSPVYDSSINRYRIRAGQSLEDWERSGWIHEQDPRGWFQWYCRFYEGRRTANDWKQVKRWQGVAGVRGRFRRALAKKIADSRAAWDDEKVSPIIRQTLQHWAYRLTQEDYEAYF